MKHKIFSQETKLLKQRCSGEILSPTPLIYYWPATYKSHCVWYFATRLCPYINAFFINCVDCADLSMYTVSFAFLEAFFTVTKEKSSRGGMLTRLLKVYSTYSVRNIRSFYQHLAHYYQVISSLTWNHNNRKCVVLGNFSAHHDYAIETAPLGDCLRITNWIIAMRLTLNLGCNR